MSDLLTLSQAAALAGTSTRQLRYAVTQGKLPAVTVGRAYCVSRADLEAWSPPQPGASLKAYWAVKKGGAPKPSTEPAYVPAMIRCLDGSNCPADVQAAFVGAGGAPVDFGVLKARALGQQDERGRWMFTEV